MPLHAGLCQACRMLYVWHGPLRLKDVMCPTCHGRLMRIVGASPYVCLFRTPPQRPRAPLPQKAHLSA